MAIYTACAMCCGFGPRNFPNGLRSPTNGVPAGPNGNWLRAVVLARPPAAMLTKAFLRRAALARRQALTAAQVAARSQQLSAQLFRHFPVAEWRGLHVFLPRARRNEPDTGPIIRRIRAEFPAVQVAVPVVQADGISLKNYALSPSTVLTENRWGIPEPAGTPETEMLPAAFDAVLVPLLAVDAAGHRVGYGAGFSDRFLAQCRPGTQFIGLNVLDEVPRGGIADLRSTDVALTASLTPGQVWRF